MLTEHVIQANFLRSAIQNVRPVVRRHSGVLVLCALALLGGCTNQSGNRAPVTDLNNASAGAARTYVIKPGDTMNKIARENGVDEATLMRLNKLVNPNRLVIGQTLKLSDGSEPAAATTRPAGTSKPETRPLDAASSASQANETPTPASDAGLISWGWPASGKVIQGFTQTTKGIDITGNAGDAIEAAANGKVMYSGNGVRGLGNLIILNHDNGFITAYAHNRTLLVKAGQDVKKGAKIAEMGQTDAASVRLHFEVRRQGTPVDPLQYLPSR
ncbi:MAG: peptidoglycan DD-metalloendopeptidase family protein [Alcaligenaceae bacterium]